MSTVKEIEDAVHNLSTRDLAAFREWFAGFDADAWYRRFENDVAAGRLDRFADEVLDDLEQGRCRDL